MKAALIGAGEESLHTIQKAQELGVYVTALDGNPDAEGLKAADEGLTIDISDEKAVLDALQDRKPDFLITGPIGRYLTTAGAVNDALGLAGISRQAAEYCTDKYLFHKKLQEKNLRNCRCLLIPAEAAPAQAGDLARDFSTLQYPAILKPRYGSGSRGIFFLNNPRELEQALTCIFPENQDTAAPTEDYVLEEAAPGVEYGVDACMDKDRFRMILLRKKLITHPCQTGHRLPERKPREDETQRLLWERAAAYLTETTALLGLKTASSTQTS
ncbi:MAG: ATP-grasp domain-containing protein [Eisenbergiella massiliensis]